MTNDKTTASGPSNFGQDVYQRSLSESEYYPPRSKRPHYENLPDAIQNVYETKKYHRLIEKRRRDRINECIYQLKDMLPADIIKSTTKPMEKAVILELVVRHMQSISHRNEGGRTSEYVRGYQDCTNHATNFLKADIPEERKKELCVYLRKEMPATERKNLNGMAPLFPSLPSNGASELILSNNEESSGDKQSASSSSLSPSSPVSDFSLCADYSDSSGGQEMANDHKIAKRKVYSHHHKSLASSNQAKRQQTSTASSTNANQNQAPVFINMPFMMTPSMMAPNMMTSNMMAPNMMPAAQFLSADGTPMVSEAQMPRLVQSYPMSAPGGVVMPRMTTDTNNVQFPTLFMACGTAQPRPETQQQQAKNAEQGVIMQPMMMPMRNQGSFMMMPSYPCMSPFQAPTLVPVQMSTEEQTSPSE